MLLTRSVIASFRSNLFMDRPPHKSLNSYFVGDDEKGMEAEAASMRSYFIPRSLLSHPPFRILPYGIGGLGTGGTPQTADAHGGSGGVGIRNPLPGVLAEPPLMQAPAKVPRLGYGRVNPSASVRR